MEARGWLSLIFHLCLLSCILSASADHAEQKRDDGLDCSGSLLCPALKTVNGADGISLDTLEALYFAMLNSSLPDSTTYAADENIICVTHSSGPTIQFSVSVGVTVGPASAGVSITTNITLPPGPDDGGICIFTEGDPVQGQADLITLGQAKALVDRLLYPTGCKCCGQIPIHYLDRNVANAANNGGLLKADYRTNDVCIDKCIGPWSFSGNTTSNTSAVANPTSRNGAASRLGTVGMIAEWYMAPLPMAIGSMLSSVMFLFTCL